MVRLLKTDQCQTTPSGTIGVARDKISFAHWSGGLWRKRIGQNCRLCRRNNATPTRSTGGLFLAQDRSVRVRVDLSPRSAPNLASAHAVQVIAREVAPWTGHGASRREQTSQPLQGYLFCEPLQLRHRVRIFVEVCWADLHDLAQSIDRSRSFIPQQMPLP